MAKLMKIIDIFKLLFFEKSIVWLSKISYICTFITYIV